MSNFWWDVKPHERHEAIFDTVKTLTSAQSYRQTANVRHMRLYSNLDSLGLAGSRYALSTSPSYESKIKLNVIRSCCDTVTNKIAKNKPKPTFITDGGNWSQQQKAKKLDRFIEGVFYAADIHEKSPRVFLDSTVFGTGFLKSYLDGRPGGKGRKYQCERVFPDEILVDENESFYDSARQLHQRKFVSREVLLNLFPDKEAKILKVSRSQGYTANQTRLVDQLLVWESWHLPSGDGAEDGRRCLSVENTTLVDEEYTIDCFPFSKIKWSERLLGYFGEGLAEQLMGIQLEINKLLRTIQVAMHLCSVPHWLVEAASTVVKSHINNEIGGIINYTGTMPQLQVMNAVPPELREHLMYLVKSAYEIAGISMLSAQSKKPEGLDSGAAIREFNDIESERFILSGMKYERLHLDAASLAIKLIKQEAELNGDYEAQFQGKRGLETINWNDVEMDEDAYVMKMFPTSFLPSTPAGRKAEVTDLMQLGFLSPEDAFSLLDFPDLKAVQNLQTAAVDDINRVIELILDEGKYIAPEPFQNLSLGMQKMQSAYLRAKLDNAPETRLELMRTWMKNAMSLLGAGSTPAPSGALPPNMPPTAAASSPATPPPLPPQAMAA